jgi:hypothetical protein
MIEMGRDVTKDYYRDATEKEKYVDWSDPDNDEHGQ